MRGVIALLTALSLMGATGGMSVAAAQEQAKPDQTPARQASFYRVDYGIYEFEDGKRTNARSYTLKVQAGREAIFRVGSRFPIATGKDAAGRDQINYYDVGLNLDCLLEEPYSLVLIRTTLELTSVASSAMVSPPSTPVIRSLRLSDWTVVEPGKATLVGAIDDVTAERRYEVDVTATKIK